MIVILGDLQKEVVEKDLMQNGKAVVIEEKVAEEEVVVEKVLSKTNLKPAQKEKDVNPFPLQQNPLGKRAQNRQHPQNLFQQTFHLQFLAYLLKREKFHL